MRKENSERQRAEERLRRSEAYLSEAQKLSHTGTFGWNPSSGEIYWTEETFRIFEYDPASSPTLELIQLVAGFTRTMLAAFRCRSSERASVR
jgi:PAS domain-containing protein